MYILSWFDYVERTCSRGGNNGYKGSVARDVASMWLVIIGISLHTMQFGGHKGKLKSCDERDATMWTVNLVLMILRSKIAWKNVSCVWLGKLM